MSISSNAFPIDGDYKIMWSDKASFEDGTYLVLKEGTVPRNNYTVTDTITIPEAKYGINYVRFWRYNRDDSVTFQFDVKPKLEIIPAQAAPGATVTVKCTGFPPGDEGVVTLDGKPTTIVPVASITGTYSADFLVPETMAGDHKFVANTPRLFTDIAQGYVKVIPTVTVSPEQPDIGAEVKVTGRGFAAKSTVQIKYDNVSVASSPATSELGSFTYVFKVPESSAAPTRHTITVQDASGNKATWGMTLEGQAPPRPTPQLPKNERFGWMGAQEVVFAWSAVSDSSGVIYTIEVAEDLNFFPLKPGMKKTGLKEPSCTLKINPGTYYWRVQAVDGVGNEGEWAISPYPFRVGYFSMWMFVGAGIVCLALFALLVRAFFRRLREYW